MNRYESSEQESVTLKAWTLIMLRIHLNGATVVCSPRLYPLLTFFTKPNMELRDGTSVQGVAGCAPLESLRSPMPEMRVLNSTSETETCIIHTTRYGT